MAIAQKTERITRFQRIILLASLVVIIMEGLYIAKVTNSYFESSMVILESLLASNID